MLAFLHQKALSFALKAGFLAVDEARITSPEKLASRSEADAVVLPVEVNLALHSSALALSYVGVVSLLAPSGASLLASRQRTLTLNSALVRALRLRTVLALLAGRGSEATLALLSTHRDALALTSRDKQG